MSRRPGIFHGVAVAAVLAFAASASLALLSPLIGLGTLIRLAAPLLALTYLVYLLRATNARTGRIVTLTAWAVFAISAFWLVSSTAFYLLLHAGAIWLVRSLHAHASLIAAFLDFGLSALGALTFAWAIARTGSIFLATWCFFLIQALWTLIPRKLARERKCPDAVAHNEPFERARRRADAALRVLLGPSG